MPPRDPLSTTRRWLGRRWYRLLMAFAACLLLGVVAVSIVLSGMRNSPWLVVYGAAAGFTCGLLFGVMHVLMSVIGAMRISTPVRGSFAVLVPTFAVVIIGQVPMRLDLQVIPVILTYCLCLGSLTTSLALRGCIGDELVARDARALRTSTQTDDAVLAAFMLLFIYAQYKNLGGWYATNAAPDVLLWSIVLSVGTSWGFVAVNRFGERRLAYVLAVAVIALFGLYSPWKGGLAFASVAPIGWCLSQELSTRSLAACGWKWQSISKSHDRQQSLLASNSMRARIRLIEQGWLSIASLFLLAVTAATLYLLTDNLPGTRPSWLHLSCSALAIGVAWASVSSIAVLAAHQSRDLLTECLLLAGCCLFLTVIATSKLNYSLYQGSGPRLDSILVAVPVAIIIHFAVHVIEHFNSVTFGTLDQTRNRISIGALLTLTLILSLEFSVLQFADVNLVFVGFITLLLMSAITMLTFRVYFVGFSWQAALAMIGLLLLLAAGWRWNRQTLTRDMAIGCFVYMSAIIAIVRWLGRQGWHAVPLESSR